MIVRGFFEQVVAQIDSSRSRQRVLDALAAAHRLTTEGMAA